MDKLTQHLPPHRRNADKRQPRRTISLPLDVYEQVNWRAEKLGVYTPALISALLSFEGASK